MNFPLPTPIPQQQAPVAQAAIPPVPNAKKTPAEVVADRIAIRQTFLAGLGIDWSPDDDDIKREHEDLPADGEIAHIDRMVPKLDAPKEEESPLSSVPPFKREESEDEEEVK
jgi:hypothetical protein